MTLSVKKIFFIAGLIFMCQIQACSHRECVPFEKNGKWGYQDDRGRTVITAQFIIASDFSRAGIAAVVDDSGWVYINRRGEKMIRPFVFDNGPDYFSEGLARFMKMNKFGFFNEKGQIVIPPQFEMVVPFQEGCAAFCNGCQLTPDGEHYRIKGGMWGFIDKKGTVIIAAEYEEAHSFEQGKARVRKNGAWMEIDKQGTVLK